MNVSAQFLKALHVDQQNSTTKCHEGAVQNVNQEAKRDHWTRRRHFNDGRSFGIKVMYESYVLCYSTWQRANKPLKLW